MKKKLPPFLAGFLCAILLISLSIGVYAAGEWPKTIEVGKINIMVNGEVFTPTDYDGTPLDVFVYKGTTYAPTRNEGASTRRPLLLKNFQKPIDLWLAVW